MEVQKDSPTTVSFVDRRTAPRRREDRLQLRWERQLYAARRICEALFQRTNIDDLIQNTLHTALDVIGASGGSVLLADFDTKQLVFSYTIGEKAEFLQGIAFPWNQGIAGAVFTSGEPEVIPDAKQDPRHYSGIDALTGYVTRDMIVLPLKRWEGEPIGVLEILNKHEGRLNEDDMDILVVVSALSAAAIEQTRAMKSLRESEEQLFQAQKMEAIGRLAGGIVHDFNNLVTVISCLSQLLLESFDPHHPQAEKVQQIKKAGERAADLTQKLLTFSRKQNFEPKILNLNDVVPVTQEMLLRLIGEDITLQTVREPDLGRVKADPSQIDQVLMNLAVNARDAMPTGGRLTIVTANVHLDLTYTARHVGLQPGPYVMLAMSDTGCGMDAKTLRHIFEPFFTTKEPGKGTGLGLSIVYGIVKQSGGHIAVESKPKEGTTFRVYFPRVEHAVESVVPKPAVAQPITGNETILLVEDDEPLRHLVSYLLQRWGYRVLEAGHGKEALQTLEQHAGSIHLLLTDIVLPGLSGYRLWEQVKALHPASGVLFMSGYADETIRQYGVTGGDFLHIKKPFAPAVLGQKLREALVMA